MKSRVTDLLLAAAWFLIDQGTKAWAASGALDRPLELIPRLLRLRLSTNRGALFGLLAEAGEPWRLLILVAVPLAAVAALVAFLWRQPPERRWTRAALILMLGGAAGNLLDRILLGHVVDFIDVHAGWPAAQGWLVRTLGTAHWPTFNFADIGLSCGTLALLGLSLFSGDQEVPTENASLPD